MLVLSRKEQEEILLQLEDGRQIWIVVTEIDKGRCRIGVTAPKDIKVLRSELLNKPKTG